MTATYKLTDSGGVLRSDGAWIPEVEGNLDYDEFQEWLKAGNSVPEEIVRMQPGPAAP